MGIVELEKDWFDPVTIAVNPFLIWTLNQWGSVAVFKEEKHIQQLFKLVITFARRTMWKEPTADPISVIHNKEKYQMEEKQNY